MTALPRPLAAALARLWVAGLLAATLPAMLLVESNAAAADLAYADALQLALDRNPSLLGAKQDLRSADGALLAARGVFDPTATANITRNSSLEQGLTFGFPTTTENRNAAWTLGINKYWSSGTTSALSWSNNQNSTLYSADNTARLEQVRQLGFLNEDQIFNSRLTATVTQSLLQGFRMATNLSGVRGATSARSQAEAEAQRVRQQVLADTAKAYWALYTQQRMAELAEASLAVAKEEQRVVEAKVEQGSLAPLERSRVAAAVVQAESALIDAQAQLRVANNALQILIGGAPGEQLSTTSAPVAVTDIPLNADEAVKAALTNNPGLQTLRMRLEAAEQDLLDAKHRLLPQLDATASYGLAGFEVGTETEPTNGLKTAAGMFDAEQRNWSLGANLSVPLGNRADRGAADQRGAALQRLRLDEQALARTTEQQVRAQVDILRSGAARLALAEANLRLATETLDAERARQESGRTVQKDVLEAIKNVDNAKIGLQQAVADHLVAIIELERLKGSL